MRYSSVPQEAEAMNALESGFISSDELIRRSGGSLIRNAGKIIAAITVVVPTAFVCLIATKIPPQKVDRQRKNIPMNSIGIWLYA